MVARFPGARFLGALLAGAVLALSWGAVHHGLGRAVLGLAAEPDTGFLPRQWTPPPADRPLRILMLGTSLTLRGEAWVKALEAALGACHPAGAQIERLARGGGNSAWGAEALRQRLAQSGLPDLLIVEFTINDASLWHGMTLDKSRDRHREILKAAAAAGLPIFLATMSPAFGREALERPGQVAYRALYPDLARAEGAGLIAMVPGWQALTPDERRAALPDGLHPTDAAMTQVAVPALTAALVPVLEPCRR